MSASQRAVEAAMRALGCTKVPNHAGLLICRTREQFHGVWSERGCPVAARIADAVTDAERAS